MTKLHYLLVVLLTSLLSFLQANIKFSHYESSKYEAEWISNVEHWQKDVCSHLPKEDIENYIANIQEINNMNSSDVFNYITGGYRNYLKYISHYHYNVTKYNGLNHYTIAIPIEGIIGLARDPRKCYNIRSEKFTQSKAFLLQHSE